MDTKNKTVGKTTTLCEGVTETQKNETIKLGKSIYSYTYKETGNTYTIEAEEGILWFKKNGKIIKLLTLSEVAEMGRKEDMEAN